MSVDPTAIRLGKRSKYSPTSGDEWLEVGKIAPEHEHRIFEGRAENGEGYLGKIIDANHYLLQGVVGIRFAGEQLGLFGAPTMQILLKPEGFEVPTAEVPE